MYTQILTPLDGSEVSEQVLPYVQSLASGLSLPITLLLAVEPEHPSVGQILNPSLHLYETHFHRASHGQAYLERRAGELREAGLSVITTVPHKEPSAAIVDEAANDPGALIAMASHGRSGLARWWMGSVADKVLHTVTNPLLIVRSQAQQADVKSAPHRLVVPVDGSELAEQSLPHVTYMAAALGLPVDLVRATLSESEYYQAMSVDLRVLPTTLPSYQSIAETLDGEALAYLADVKTRLLQQGVPSVEERVLQGPPADSIVDLATAGDNGLIVMTTHGRSGVGRMLLGSVAERVVRHSSGPVLLIRAAHCDQTPMSGAPAVA